MVFLWVYLDTLKIGHKICSMSIKWTNIVKGIAKIDDKIIKNGIQANRLKQPNNNKTKK